MRGTVNAAVRRVAGQGRLRTGTTRVIVAAAAVAVLPLASTAASASTAWSAASVSAPTAAAVDTLTWGACPPDAAAPGLQCSTLDVPLD